MIFIHVLGHLYMKINDISLKPLQSDHSTNHIQFFFNYYIIGPFIYIVVEEIQIEYNRQIE